MKFFQYALLTSFLTYFVTQHLICKNFHFVRRGAPELKKSSDIQKLFQLGLCKKIFFLKAKKYFVLDAPNVRTKILIFEYFPKIPSEMISTHPFYPILIPNTPYEKSSLFFFLVVVGSQKSKNISYNI